MSADLVFKCPGCGMALSVEDQYVGAELTCPDCSDSFNAPMPLTVFPCKFCHCPLSAPGSVLGESLACPNCERAITVPAEVMVCCPSCSTYLEMDDAYMREYGGQVVACPECEWELTVPEASEILESRPVEPPPDWQGGNDPDSLGKTMKLDSFLDTIPQSQSLERGNCPYCNQRLFRLHEKAYVCKRCNRVIQRVKRKRR